VDSAFNISDTGIKGFLKWLQVAQPGIYQQAAPKIAAAVPAAFSDYHAGGWRSFGSLGQNAADPTGTFSTSSFDPNEITVSPDVTTAVDTADAANTGAGSGSLSDTISSIVNGVASLWMTQSQVQLNSQIVNTQLQRAAAGLAPLPINPTTTGLPVIQATAGQKLSTFVSQNPYLAAALAAGGLYLLTHLGRR
jgi:hypothetical protein